MRAGDWLVVSGQVGVAEGVLVEGGIEAEVQQALVNLVAVLATEGASLANVVRTGVFLRHISDYPVMNEIYVEVFADSRPARSTVAVAGLPLGALVEIDALAFMPSSQ